MNSKNYGKSGSLEIIYITFLIYDMPAMFFSILNTWQTLLTNHSFLRQLQTSSQDSTTIAFSHKWFKKTSLLTIKSSSELFISQMRKWTILDSVQQKTVHLLDLLSVSRGLHFKRLPSWLKSTLNFEDVLN